MTKKAQIWLPPVLSELQRILFLKLCHTMEALREYVDVETLIVIVKKLMLMYVCCMYFESWHNDVLDGDGAEWIFCKCGRWLHENCVEEVVEDEEGFQ